MSCNKLILKTLKKTRHGKILLPEPKSPGTVSALLMCEYGVAISGFYKYF